VGGQEAVELSQESLVNVVLHKVSSRNEPLLRSFTCQIFLIITKNF